MKTLTRTLMLGAAFVRVSGGEQQVAAHMMDARTLLHRTRPLCDFLSAIQRRHRGGNVGCYPMRLDDSHPRFTALLVVYCVVQRPFTRVNGLL